MADAVKIQVAIKARHRGRGAKIGFTETSQYGLVAYLFYNFFFFFANVPDYHVKQTNGDIYFTEVTNKFV